MFDAVLKKVSPNISIHIIDLKAFSLELEEYLDTHFVSICEGDTGGNLQRVKTTIIGFLETKDNRTKMGATAEFFLHLYLKHIGFNQECLFLNLEERSIKKGFDGYYSIDSEEFIMESKSGSSWTDSISHGGKIKEAYTDLKNNLAGKSKKSKNNPWRNAFNHARVVGTEKNIKDNIKKLSDNYDDSIYYDIEDFNIIPASTIFLDDYWTNEYSNDIIDELESLSRIFKFNNMNMICVTKKSLTIFENYLKK